MNKLILILLTVTAFFLNVVTWWTRRKSAQTTPLELEEEEFIEEISWPPSASTEIRFAERPLFGPEGERLILATARTIIADEDLVRWRDFDQEFTAHCLQQNQQGLAFDRAAFEALDYPIDEELVRWGVAVYNACSKGILKDSGGGHQNLYGIIAQIYLAALMTLRRTDKGLR